MEITVKRKFKNNSYTIGDMFLDGEFFCNTIEDKVRDLTKEDKVYGKTAIPEGIYKVLLTQSNKFKRLLPILLDVPHFTGIRIHSGNTEEDSLGCIIVGENKVKGKVINSRITENKLMEILKKESNITIKIV